MRNWILRWLGLAPRNDQPSLATTRSLGNAVGLSDMPERNLFEIIQAVNGKIVVFNRHKHNPHGPDKNHTEIYLVHEGDNLMDTVSTAIVSAALK